MAREKQVPGSNAIRGPKRTFATMAVIKKKVEPKFYNVLYWNGVVNVVKKRLNPLYKSV